MGTRIPASMRTREALSALIEGRLTSPAGRSELVELATRLIVEEALEGEVRDALDRGYYERGDAPGQGHRNGHRTHRLKTAEGGIEYAAPQVAGLEQPFRSALRGHLKGHTEARGACRCVTSRTLSRTRPGGCCCRRPRFAKSASSSRGLQAFKSMT
jgi:putative transposase